MQLPKILKARLKMRIIITSLLAGIIVALGYVLFLITGVILSFAFDFVAQTVMIDGRSGTRALKASYLFVEANLSDALIVVLASLANLDGKEGKED
jgi:hypothetical protein